MSNQNLIANPGGTTIASAATTAALEAGVNFARRFGFYFFGDPAQIMGLDQTEQMRRHAQALWEARQADWARINDLEAKVAALESENDQLSSAHRDMMEYLDTNHPEWRKDAKGPIDPTDPDPSTAKGLYEETSHDPAKDDWDEMFDGPEPGPEPKPAKTTKAKK